MSLFTLALILCSLNAFAEGEFYYSVPVDNPKLEPYAIFLLENPSSIKEGAKVTFSYSLPKELVGNNFPPIILSGEDYGTETFTLAGENATAECQRVEQQTLCKMSYGKLDINKPDVSKAIKETSKSLKERRVREKVAKIFKDDPVGILSF